ncbi:CLUMA_CG015252, isoform A [Clunio marinus]|uniref:Origin recognition complex subunit 1 n=1 Tax=Clunio marinus TaxID=568069 RepID=A0A1J1IPY3_9DIPT|nr:CLUMA_CG015252, isoform A [Clunio marinus]
MKTEADISVRWIGNYYDENIHHIEELKHKHNLYFYRKCALNKLIIKQNDIICLNDTVRGELFSYETCSVAKILYLYEDTSNRTPIYRASVQWYSRPSDLIRVVDNPGLLNTLDKNNELIEECRYSTEISFDDIFDVGVMLSSKNECLQLHKPKGRFFCNYKLEKIGKGRKYSLVNLKPETSVKLILRRVSNDDNTNNLKSPHDNWVVSLNKINENDDDLVLNAIENISQRTPKRILNNKMHKYETPVKRRSKVTIETENINSDHDKDSSPEDKIKKSGKKAEKYVPITPQTKSISRRKSILKTPTSSKTNTPRRSIQFSKVVEEYKYEKKNVKEKCEAADEVLGLSSVRKRLHVSSVPKNLPCREKEFREIYSFLEGNLLDKIGGCIYISGVPGTGKTATTTEVMKALKEQVEEGNLPDFEFVDINGMRITEPRKAYVEIYRQMTGKTVPWEQAYNLLNKRFSTPSPRLPSTILVVDELDILCNRRQDVVYNILNWPNLNAARLIVVTIANTMDLPERVLMGRVSSRLGLTRLTFQPYSHKQLQEIVASRLNGSDTFNSDAIQLVARKVAALSGDARRALDICRRASEIAESEASDKKSALVSMSHVQQALNEMISCTKVRAIKSCSEMEKLFLQAVCMEVERIGVEEVLFRGVYNQLKTLTTLNGFEVISVDMALAISSRLGASRLLICEHTNKDIYQKILLNISADDFYYATQLRNQE